MSREADPKQRNSPGICLKFLKFVVKQLFFYAAKAVAFGSSRSEASRSVFHEDYSEIAIENVQTSVQEEEDEMMSRNTNSEAQGKEMAEEEKVATRKKLAAMSKKGSIMKEKLKFEHNIDERSGKFIKKGKESFSS